MKPIVRLVVIMLAMVPAIGFAQTTKKTWAEEKTFHSLMGKTFHPIEDGNYAPLKAKADSLSIAAKAWQASVIPDNYKPAETKENLDKLAHLCNVLAGAVAAKADDRKLKVLITDAHDTFHKITGECKKTE